MTFISPNSPPKFSVTRILCYVVFITVMLKLGTVQAIMFILPIILCCSAQNFDLCIKLNIITPLLHYSDWIVLFQHRSEDISLRKTDKNNPNVQQQNSLNYLLQFCFELFYLYCNSLNMLLHCFEKTSHHQNHSHLKNSQTKHKYDQPFYLLYMLHAMLYGESKEKNL